jgi:hypothetical protein
MRLASRRCQLKHGVRVNRIRLSHVADAKTFCKDDLILENHGNSDARDPCYLHLVLGELLQLRRGGLDLFKGQLASQLDDVKLD